MAATNVPVPQLTDAGLLVPQDADTLAGVLADLQAAFGGALNPALTTPQGQLATSQTAALSAAYDLLLLLVNQIDPAYSSGRMQDAIARLYFLERMPPIATTVTATIIGATGTVIPVGSLAQATDGNIYQSLDAVTIGQNGTVAAQFAALSTGATVLAAGSLTRIYRAVPGWDAVTNAAPGIPGQDEESRADFEARRAASVAINAVGILPSIRAAVLSVSGVLDAYVTENSTGSAITIGGVSIAPHSLYVAVEGGADSDVARAIWSKKNPGCDYNGNTTVTVEDTTSGYNPPYPAYNVTYQRPSTLAVSFTVTISTNTAIPNDAQTQIANALVAAFSDAARIGATIYASQYVRAVIALGDWVQIVGITVNGAISQAVRIDQFPTLAASAVTVVLV